MLTSLFAFDKTASPADDFVFKFHLPRGLPGIRFFIIMKEYYAHQQRYRESAGDHNDLPAFGYQCLFRQGQHAAPGDNFQRQTHTHKAQGGFCADSSADVHDHHEQDGGDKAWRQVLDQNVEELATHTFGRRHIFT